MEELKNKERIHYGTIEFFVFGGITGVCIFALDSLNDKYLDGWLFWIIVALYGFLIPAINHGRTLFMVFMGLYLVNENDNSKISFSTFVKRTVLKLVTIIPESFSMRVINEGIPSYDKKLKIKLIKK
jgi:hypothetical protein